MGGMFADRGGCQIKCSLKGVEEGGGGVLTLAFFSAGFLLYPMTEQSVHTPHTPQFCVTYLFGQDRTVRDDFRCTPC